ncbi:MAG: DnaD domain protein [Lachnospiraceae bacterium]|nr:DnaD domain protein [Lachnospiraceae bacterium]
MGRFKVYQDPSSDMTLVSNRFIDHYLPDANDAQIKIYLYLLRTLGADAGCSVSDLADRFNFTEKDVERALSYWNKKGLIRLIRDGSSAISGIVFNPVPDPLPPVKEESLPENAGKAPLTESASSDPESAPSSPEPASSVPKKIEYSADDVNDFRNKADTAELIFVVEQYLNKTLTPSEIRTLIFFKDPENGLGFSNDLIDYLFEYCLSRDKKSFRYIETVAIRWAEDGITDPKQAAEKTSLYQKEVYEVMKSLGKSSAPTRTEVDYVTKWTKDMAFSMDIIYEACARTVNGTDKRRFQYADKILTSWFEKNVHSKADIEALDREREKESKKASGNAGDSGNSGDQRGTGTAAVPQYKQFSQRTYDFDELEKELLKR